MPKILLMGRPGVGKTTIIQRVVGALGESAGGFYTQEIRERGTRQGFRIVTLDGQDAVLAHVTFRGPHRVGKYGVDVGSLERVGVAALHRAVTGCDLVVIDEIGKMEMFSATFRTAVLVALESEGPLLGTILLAPHPWADGIKHHPEVELLIVTGANRDQLPEQILCSLGKPTL